MYEFYVRSVKCDISCAGAWPSDGTGSWAYKTVRNAGVYVACVHVCIYIKTNTHMYTHTRSLNNSGHWFMDWKKCAERRCACYVCVCTRVYVCIQHTSTHAHMYQKLASIYMYLCIRVHLSIYMYLCIRVHISPYTFNSSCTPKSKTNDRHNTHTHTHTHTHKTCSLVDRVFTYSF
jgi:hypothetical protein